MRDTTIDVVSQILLLLPIHRNKLEIAWQGPYKVTEKLSDCNFCILQGNKEKIYHTNLLKEYRERPTNCVVTIVIKHHETSVPVTGMMSHPGLTKFETVQEVLINPELKREEQKQLRALLDQYTSTFTDKSGQTTLCEFSIPTMDNIPVRVKPFKLSYAKQETVRLEIQEMLEMGVIEKAIYHIAPLSCLSKKNYGICIDTNN